MNSDDPIPMPKWGVSALNRLYPVYRGPRWLAWMTRVRLGRWLLRPFYRLESLAHMQHVLNMAFSERIDELGW